MSTIDMRGRPRIEVEAQIEKEFAAKYKVGDHLPTQTEGAAMLRCSQSSYSKSLRSLAKKGVVTRVGYGGGYVWGSPDEKTLARLVSEERERRRKNNGLAKDVAGSGDATKKGCVTRSLRNDIRSQIASAIMKEGIAEHVVQALRDHDLVHLTCCEKALKLVGCTFDQSEEAAELMKKAGGPPVSNITAINFQFTQASGNPNQGIEAEVVEEANERG